MATTAKTVAIPNGSRDRELRKILEDRRRELAYDVRGKIRDGRRDLTQERDVIDEGECSEVDIQEGIGFALIEMKAETLRKIDAVLRRIEEGTYGECFECGEDIPAERLRALPFALRCKECEETREATELHERLAHRLVSSLLVNVLNQ